MANTYAAKFGDVVKHAVLCEVVVRERPPRYLESHGGRLVYDPAGLKPGPGGVWDFLEVASDHDDLSGSTYAELARREAGTRHDPGKYPGSIALASERLPAESDVVASELVPASATERAEGLAAIGRSATVAPVPFDPDTVWGSKSDHRVSGTVNGRNVRASVERLGDGFGVVLGPAWRQVGLPAKRPAGRVCCAVARRRCVLSPAAWPGATRIHSRPTSHD